MTDQKHTKEQLEADALVLARNVPLRVVACVNALAGIDDPEAFMRDFKDLVENIESAYVDGQFVKSGLQDMKDEHLKGGAE